MLVGIETELHGLRHCVVMGDWAGAVEFLLMAGQPDDAFQMAHDHKEMATYAAQIPPDARETLFPLSPYAERCTVCSY